MKEAETKSSPGKSIIFNSPNLRWKREIVRNSLELQSRTGTTNIITTLSFDIRCRQSAQNPKLPNLLCAMFY